MVQEAMMNVRESACHRGDQHVTEGISMSQRNQHVTEGTSMSQGESASHRGSQRVTGAALGTDGSYKMLQFLCPLRHKGELPVFVYLPFPGLALARPCTHPQPFLNKIAVTVTSHLPPNHFSLVEGFTAQMQGEMLRGNQHVTTTATLF
eukprot:scaffold261152_cov19-Tisochrysis_lutea.AAC.1